MGGDEGVELEFRGKTGSFATVEVPLKVEGQSGLSGVLQRDVGADRWSARELCRPGMTKQTQVNAFSAIMCHL